MRNRKDFYKYNFILAIVVFLSILMHIDNTANKPAELPNFSPKRYIASTQKARQSIQITLTQEKLSEQNQYKVDAEVSAPELDGHALNYRWILSPTQKVLQGTPSGILTAGDDQSLSLIVEDSEPGKLKLEITSVVNGIKLGGMKTVRLFEAPTEEEVQTMLHSQSAQKISNTSKSKVEMVKEIFQQQKSTVKFQQ